MVGSIDGDGGQSTQETKTDISFSSGSASISQIDADREQAGAERARSSVQCRELTSEVIIFDRRS
jgi:hypothetical protein